MLTFNNLITGTKLDTIGSMESSFFDTNSSSETAQKFHSLQV